MHITEESFAAQDYRTQALPKGRYEYCSFRNCHFAQSDLSGVRFLDTEFIDCDFSNAKITNTSFQDVNFRDCKMLGLPFNTCHRFGFAVSFDHCQLSHSSFYQWDLRHCSFQHCQLEGVDFTEANLAQVSLPYCDLLNAAFERTILSGADLRGATRYTLDPELNQIKGAKFSLSEVVGLLGKYGIKVE